MYLIKYFFCPYFDLLGNKNRSILTRMLLKITINMGIQLLELCTHVYSDVYDKTVDLYIFSRSFYIYVYFLLFFTLFFSSKCYATVFVLLDVV